MAVIIKVVMTVLIGMGVSEYSSVYSKRMYSDHAKISLLVLRQYLDVSYDRFSDILGSMDGVMTVAGIGDVPDPSTLRKFSVRIDPGTIKSVIRNTAKMVCGPDMIGAVDSTGFSCSSASKHYEKRLREMSGNKGDMSITYSSGPVRGYCKASLAVDTNTLTVLAADICASNNSDVKRLPYLIDDLKGVGFSISCMTADKGYDSEYAHRYIRENLGCVTMIPLRKTEPARLECSKRRTRARGFFRGLMKIFFDPEIYKKRSMVETVNSMIKRNMSDIVRGRNDVSREVEVLCRCAAHNVMRVMDLGVTGVC